MEMPNPESKKLVQHVYERVNINVDGKEVGLNFYHIGVQEDSKEKITIDPEALSELTKKFDLLEQNPEIGDGGTNIYLDYRSLPRRVFDATTKKFGKDAPRFFSRTFGLSEAQPEHDYNNRRRHIYVCKPSKLIALFTGRGKKGFEKIFKHEYKHLAHTYANLDVKKEVSMRLLSWAGVIASIYPTAKGISEIMSNNVSLESVGLAFGGALIFTSSHKLLRATPTESEAIAAERVETDKPLFIYPENSQRSRNG